MLISKNMVPTAVGAISMKSVLKEAFLYPNQNNIGNTMLKCIKTKPEIVITVIVINSKVPSSNRLITIGLDTSILIIKIISAIMYLANTICVLASGKLFTITSLLYFLSSLNVFKIAITGIIADIIT